MSPPLWTLVPRLPSRPPSPEEEDALRLPLPVGAVEGPELQAHHLNGGERENGGGCENGGRENGASLVRMACVIATLRLQLVEEREKEAHRLEAGGGDEGLGFRV